jgi:hypothetical protein
VRPFGRAPYRCASLEDMLGAEGWSRLGWCSSRGGARRAETRRGDVGVGALSLLRH